MFVIPVGSDAALRHRPLVTYVVVGLFALATLALMAITLREILRVLG